MKYRRIYVFAQQDRRYWIMEIVSPRRPPERVMENRFFTKPMEPVQPLVIKASISMESTVENATRLVHLAQPRAPVLLAKMVLL